MNAYTVTPHSYYRDQSQARRMAWIRRRAYYQRTGRLPPLVWADPPILGQERTTCAHASN